MAWTFNGHEDLHGAIRLFLRCFLLRNTADPFAPLMVVLFSEEGRWVSWCVCTA